MCQGVSENSAKCLDFISYSNRKVDTRKTNSLFVSFTAPFYSHSVVKLVKLESSDSFAQPGVKERAKICQTAAIGYMLKWNK